MINKIFGKAPVVRSLEMAAALGSLGYLMYVDYSAPGLWWSGWVFIDWLRVSLVCVLPGHGWCCQRRDLDARLSLRREVSFLFFGGGLIAIAGLLGLWDALNVDPRLSSSQVWSSARGSISRA